uniref:Uncharacterized protein n=1 Tax=viral metagenome TaxID=1070528 RepID=A0A6M3K3F5_9ZZZZ
MKEQINIEVRRAEKKVLRELASIRGLKKVVTPMLKRLAQEEIEQLGHIIL